MAVFNNYMEKKAMTLWMGDLDDAMDEAMIGAAFLAVGETVSAVKVIKNRLNGQPAGYCFVEFPTIEASQRALLRLNGKSVPNTDPPKRFKLNTASKNKDIAEEYSIFVGDLTENVDDFTLYEAFQKRYPSTRGAKVVLGQGGISRGFGFVRFGSQAEQLSALREMQNWIGLGERPIRVSSATPRKQWEQKEGWSDRNNAGGGGGGGGGGAVVGPQPDWAANPSAGGTDSQNWQQWQQYYQQQQYWQYQQQYSSQWGEYWQQNYQAGQTAETPNGAPVAPAVPETPPPTKASKSDDPNEAFDVESSNAELIARCEDFMKTLDDSQWFSDILNFPCIAAN